MSELKERVDNTSIVKLLNDFIDYASFHWKLQLCMTKYTGFGYSLVGDDEINSLIDDFIEQYTELKIVEG